MLSKGELDISKSLDGLHELALQKHYEWNDKIEIISRASIKTKDDLSLAYTLGVAAPCLEIAKEEDKAYELTRKNNLVAVKKLLVSITFENVSKK